MQEVKEDGYFAPLVSIGMPIYNAADHLQRAIDSVLDQSFGNFELIISDNASTDISENLCRAYAQRDRRIRYIRQDTNLGAVKNFNFVLNQSRGKYFMWAASDDIRTPDFLMENVQFLEENPGYVASTTPNCFEGNENDPTKIVNFSIEGDLSSRYIAFLHSCWHSHGIFYSLMRTDIIKKCDIPGQSFTAADWAIDMFLASHGAIHRTKAGLAIFGRKGMSSRPDAWKSFRTHPLEFLLPLVRFSRHALRLMKPLAFPAWIRVFCILARLNLSASTDQAHAALYAFYCRNFKPVNKSGAH
ncbi:glycosyltransferase family 2 protein [Propionivibrio dicarboxylicus]|uniref:Glycosyltransferase involved in cell wall bisynthesis n=1 Tax=Propionivibrio dicarboxylicus TaxID=83767 RepID=A0A1G8DZ15_9RHOO|nr:glycosyltransferase family 2 protein [Propionivibrio dicarboxylicus]SDH62883.1 Glycosyltransferase involved in cell wall bisynthesis [Propionivibrio dicarboxylicus]